MTVPNAVEPGADRVVDVGGGVSLRFYADGTVRVAHTCARPGRFTIRCAPRLQLAEGGHRLDSVDPPTVVPSIRCPDCGLHGFVTAGVWRST